MRKHSINLNVNECSFLSDFVVICTLDDPCPGQGNYEFLGVLRDNRWDRTMEALPVWVGCLRPLHPGIWKPCRGRLLASSRFCSIYAVCLDFRQLDQEYPSVTNLYHLSGANLGLLRAAEQVEAGRNFRCHGGLLEFCRLQHPPFGLRETNRHYHVPALAILKEASLVSASNNHGV